MSDESNAPEAAEVPRKRSYAPAIIWARQHGVQEEIETIRRYLDSVTSAFAREYKRHEESLKATPDDMEDHEGEWYAENHAEMQAYYIDRFPDFALETSFVSTYAFLEDQMMNICRLVGSCVKIKLGPEQINEKGIEAAERTRKTSATSPSRTTGSGSRRKCSASCGTASRIPAGRAKADN